MANQCTVCGAKIVDTNFVRVKPTKRQSDGLAVCPECVYNPAPENGYS